MRSTVRLRGAHVWLGQLAAVSLAAWLMAGCNLLLDNEKRSLTSSLGGDPPDGSVDPAPDSGPVDAGADAAIMSMMSLCDSPSAQCTPNALDDGTEACGLCGSGMKTRQRGCSAECRWGPWSEWSDCQINPDACMPGMTQRVMEPCGNCNLGTRWTQRSCTEDCYWEDWQPEECMEPEGTCTPKQVMKLAEQSCGPSECGVQRPTKTCNDQCQWGNVVAGVCDVTTVVCAPGQTQMAAAVGCNANFCNKGKQQQIQTCTKSCTWGPPTPMGSCTIPEGVCRPLDQGGNLGYRCRQGDPGYREVCRMSTASPDIACTYGPREKFSGCN